MSANASVSATMRPAEWGMLILLSIVWGGAFFFVSVAVTELPVMTIVLCRVGGAALILLAVMAVMGQRLHLSDGLWRDFLVMGFLNNVVPFCSFVWAQNYIGGGLAAIMNASTPLIGAVVAHLLTKDEKLTPLRFAGVVIGLFGVMVMMGSDVFSGDLSVQIWGQLACILAALSYSFAGVWGRRFNARGISPVASATGQVSGASVILLPLVFWIDQPWGLALPSLPVIAALLAIASVSTAFAYLLYFRILSTAGATNILLVTFLVPISAVILGVSFLEEILLTRHLVGMGIIGLGLVAIDGRLLKALVKQR